MKLTNMNVLRYGEAIGDWPCDVGGSNASIEVVVEYRGRQYSVITDWEGNPRNPNGLAGMCEEVEAR